MIEIKDCRGKEILRITKVGGDLEFRVVDACTEDVKFVIRFELKQPWMRSYRKIEELLELIKTYLKEQP